MHPLIWSAAGAASSLGWKWSRDHEAVDEDQAPPDSAEVEVEEPPPPGLLRTTALYLAMVFVTAGRWVRSTGSAIFKSTFERAPETTALSPAAGSSEGEAEPDDKPQEPR